jgi:hypothetical protein
LPLGRVEFIRFLKSVVGMKPVNTTQRVGKIYPVCHEAGRFSGDSEKTLRKPINSQEIDSPTGSHAVLTSE